jgi:hypothetical protein
LVPAGGLASAERMAQNHMMQGIYHRRSALEAWILVRRTRSVGDFEHHRKALFRQGLRGMLLYIEAEHLPRRVTNNFMFPRMKGRMLGPIFHLTSDTIPVQGQGMVKNGTGGRSKQFRFMTSEDELTKLEMLAKERGVSQADIVRGLILAEWDRVHENPPHNLKKVHANEKKRAR